jgi:hypothetical protein
MNFLIQTYDGIVEHDFSLALIESCKYLNWIHNTNDYKYTLTDDVLKPGFIPVGSVEFVSNYLSEIHGIVVSPKNIPEELFKFCSRKIINGTEMDINSKKFFKSNDQIKGLVEINDSAPAGNYQISDIIEIDSEWRSFVYKGKLVGLQNYSGDFTIFPNV